MAILHSLNALRVIAEFFVVRHHIVHFQLGMDMFVSDLMSFFFVLSGFVLMYTHYDRKFSSRQDIFNFWYGRLTKMYPTYLTCLLFRLHLVFIIALDFPDRCVFELICPLLQFFFLNNWVGCGIRFITNVQSWYLSTLVWFWLVFPVSKEFIKNLFSIRPTLKMIVISVLSTALIYPFSDNYIFTLCPFPLFRVGEFLIGCGCACIVKERNDDDTRVITRIPAALSVVYLALLYGLLSFRHPFNDLCLHAEIETSECIMWQKSVWIPMTTPCRMGFQKYFNKHALLWAVIIHFVSCMEKAKSTGFLMQLLNHDIFKTLSQFSIELYLGHIDMNHILNFVPVIFGWGNIWTYDLLILCVYAMCYLLHVIIHKVVGICSWCRRQQADPVTTESLKHTITEKRIDHFT